MTPPLRDASHLIRRLNPHCTRALEALGPYLDRRPLVVSSKGVGRVFNILLGGQGRMQVGNGEIVEFVVVPGAQMPSVRVRRPNQI